MARRSLPPSRDPGVRALECQACRGRLRSWLSRHPRVVHCFNAPNRVALTPRFAPSLMLFSRRQLVERDYNPLADLEGPDPANLEKRYGRGERSVPLDHAAAVRGILVSDGKNDWQWVWDWALLHDEMVRKFGYDRLYARYRNQATFPPTVEFEFPAVAEPRRMLLRETPILPDDNI